MCAVSMVSDYYMQTWPQRWPNNPVPQFDDKTKRLLREALERLDKIDKRLGDIECHDEAKKKFLESIGMNSD